MSAGIDFSDKLAYVGERPWHGVGEFMGDAPVDMATAQEKSGLTWKVGLEDVKTATGIDVPDYRAVVRDDVKLPIGIVGTSYEPVQNDALFQFFDGVAGVGNASYHVCGSLHNGRRVWILGKLPHGNGPTEVVKGDEVDRYLLLASSHDGSLAVRLMFTPVRVVCANTLNVALYSPGRRISNVYRVSHLISAADHLDANKAREILGLSKEFHTTFMDGARALAAKDMTAKSFTRFLDVVFPEKPKALPSGQPAVAGLLAAPKQEDLMVPIVSTRRRELITTLFESGKGNDMKGVKGTAWAAFNAVTEYTDHVQGRDADNRANSILFGGAQQLKQAAWNHLQRKA